MRAVAPGSGGPDFFDADGRPAALYKIRYLDGDLAGDHQDLEAYEVEESTTDAPDAPARSRFKCVCPPPNLDAALGRRASK